MYSYLTIFLCAFLSASGNQENWIFPPGFKFGAASASYQVEGAWNISDKAESIWDRLTHANTGVIWNNNNGDVACDSYNLWETDIKIAAELGLHFYRFSISWPRLLPKGFATHVSEDGSNYYNNLINGLLDKGIEPLVTLYHWDLPQSIQDLGGWTNPLIADWFADYARIVFSLYGDRVRMWLTINEPVSICDVAYNSGQLAPGIVNIEHGAYLCNKHVLLAHAKAYRVYDKEFRAKYHGELSIANQLIWYEPWTEDDVELADLAVQNLAGRYSHPIYSKEGGWPPAIEEIIAENSQKKGYLKSTLPAFTTEEIDIIRGTYDFYAMNYYLSQTVRPAFEDEVMTPFGLEDIPELYAITGSRPEWPVAEMGYNIFPEGIRRQLVWLKKHYGDIKFAITENGYPTTGGLSDSDRIIYYQLHLKQLLLAINEDGINLTHYTVWAMLDNFEWSEGYRTGASNKGVSVRSAELKTFTPEHRAASEREEGWGQNQIWVVRSEFYQPKRVGKIHFGESRGTRVLRRTRVPRDSALYYATVIKNHGIDTELLDQEELQKTV